MALIQEPRFVEWLKRTLNLKETPRLELGDTIIPVIQVADPTDAEHALHRSEPSYLLQNTESAQAALFNFIRLENQVNSGFLVIVERIFITTGINAAAPAAYQNIATVKSVSGAAGVAQDGRPLDTRRNSPVGVSGVPGGISVTKNNRGAVNAVGVQCNAAPYLDLPFYSGMAPVISPGWSLEVEQQVANIALTVSFFARIRPVETGENQ